MNKLFQTENIYDVAAQIGEQMHRAGYKISCAESCTGGGLAFALTSVPGSSAWFEQAYVTYSNTAKIERLGVSQSSLEKYGAVSCEVVSEMAQGLVNKHAVQLAVAISGIAGPGGATPNKPVGLVCFGFYLAGEYHALERQFTGDRHSIREQAISFALTKLNHWLATNVNK